MSALVRYDEMCRAIDAAYQVDEVKDIRDKAMAIEHYSRQAKNTEAERRACEIRLRAERKAGQLLAEREKPTGARGNPGGRGARIVRSHDDTTQTLADLGVSKGQSSRWQQLAAVPEEQFEAAFASQGKLSTSGIITSAKPPAPKVEPMDDHALWLWGRLRDFERDGLLARSPDDLLDAMTDAMQADVLRLAPLARVWLKGFDDA